MIISIDIDTTLDNPTPFLVLNKKHKKLPLNKLGIEGNLQPGQEHL